MEKLEKHIKNTLEGREIKPSPKAWEKISSQLEPIESSKSGLSYRYVIAAGFVVLFLLSIFFLKPETAEENVLPVVEGQKTDVNITQSKDAIVGTKTKDSNVSDGEKFIQDEGKDDKSFLESSEVQIASESTIQDDFIIESDALIAQKVSEIVAQVELLETVNTEVSDAEVDSLLRSAQRQILTEKLFKDSGTVDAMALLTEVEDELDQSFRNQIFEALKDGYFKLRTAVADRNN